MSYAKVITVCCWRRPAYLKECLEHLRRATGIAGYQLLFFVDGPPHAEVVSVCRAVNWAPTELHASPTHLGCNGNTRRALRRGYELTDYLIHIEDDICVGPDAIRYFEWGRQFQTSPHVFNIGLWRHPDGWLPGRRPFPAGRNYHQMVTAADGMHIWGWASWRDRWLQMDAHWTTGEDNGPKKLSWDTALTQYRHDTGRVAYIPLISRAINIGAELGTHTGATILSYWSGSPGFKLDYTWHVVPKPPPL